MRCVELHYSTRYCHSKIYLNVCSVLKEKKGFQGIRFLNMTFAVILGTACPIVQRGSGRKPFELANLTS